MISEKNDNFTKPKSKTIGLHGQRFFLQFPYSDLVERDFAFALWIMILAGKAFKFVICIFEDSKRFFATLEEGIYPTIKWLVIID